MAKMAPQVDYKDAIVISGMSGKVANANNLAEFKHQIYNRKDMISTCKRFERTSDAPERYGAIPAIDKFDNGFFSIHGNQVDIIDPVSRMALEITCEALWDAGISLEEMKGARATVYVGHCFSENERLIRTHTFKDISQLIGMTNLCWADKISYFLGIDGPKCCVDTACSSSLFALEHSFKALNAGKVDYALVYGHSLLLSPYLMSQFYRLGVLSPDGCCKSFDRNANGYVRADGVQCLILQRAGNARRQYAEIVNILTNCDGFKEEGITFPSSNVQMGLFKNFYTECNVSLNKIGFLEAHGTGTAVGDPIELHGIESFFCKGRKDPLLIGSVKSNLGHAEGASGINSIIKSVWILQSDKIAPNIHYHSPNTENDALMNGKMHVVTSITDLPKDKPYVAVNNFGFGGANVHVLLTKPRYTPVRSNLPEEGDNRLVCISGRTDESITSIYDDLKARPFDVDFIALLNSSLGRKTDMLDYRGYCIANKNGISKLEYTEYREDPLPLKCFFHTSGVVGLVPTLIKFKRFQEHLQQVNEVLTKNKIEPSLFQNSKASQEGNIESVIVTIVVQTGIIELIKLITPNIARYMGSGIGELSAAYADGVFSLEQAILIGHRIITLLRKKHSEIDTNIIKAEIQDICTMKQYPQKWQLQKNITVQKNLSQYISEILFTSHIPDTEFKNVLIIGGNCSNSPNVINLSDCQPETGFLHAIGRLHLHAYDMNVNNIYSITFPVRQLTPMISPLVKWQHKKSWKYSFELIQQEIKCIHINQWSSTDFGSVYGHNIDGRILFPATGYLRLVWDCIMRGKQDPFKFENVAFHRACAIDQEQSLELIVQYQRATGQFQVTEKSEVVASGYIKYVQNFGEEWVSLPQMPVPKKETIMNKRDTYKELRLRGYYYEGQFKEIQSYNITGSVAYVKWTEWCPFLDTLLQVKILGLDTRSLYIPTKIRQLLIHPGKHLDSVYASGDHKNCILPVYNYEDLNVIRCGYVEFRGLDATSIAKRKLPDPVLETYRFIPYVYNLDLENASRVIVQIALENSYIIKVKVIEEVNNVPEWKPMLPYIQNALNDQPIVQPDLSLSEVGTELSHISTVNKAIGNENSNFIAIGCNLSCNKPLFSALLGSLKHKGYLISRENLQYKADWSNFNVICEYTTSTEKIVMLQLATKVVMPYPIHITEEGFSWIETLKTARNTKEKIVIYSENEPKNGLMGLTNCLIKESGNDGIMSILIEDVKAPKFDINDKFYQMQLNKKLTFNVLKNGVWGSYRHLLIDPNLSVETTHSYANNTIRGDLSSLTWMQGPLSIPEYFIGNELETLHIYASALNFKDVMFTSGKIIVDSLITDRLLQDNCLGFECTGRKENGERVMAIWSAGMISNIIRIDPTYMWSIPEHWTMTEAATVPCVYLTNIYGLIERAKLREGDSILIHSATGGIGLSAINIAIYYKCKIFLTVGTPEKKEYILKNYPSIEPNHIGNSRNTSFYKLIKKQTNGRGVDVILNSLADEKLQASVRCLAVGGRFVEIGKFDCTQDSPLRLELADREAEYHGVMVDDIIENRGEKIIKMGKILVQGITDGYIKPLPYTLFDRNQLEPAFRFMTTGKHIGKVIVSIRKEEIDKKAIPTTLKCHVKPKLYCNPKGTYIILGGLGGFGLELADFLILRGARNIVLVSRKGISNGYQQLRIKTWKSYNCEVHISTEDCTTLEGCTNLLVEAKKGGDVMGIYNLAAIFCDAVFENQYEDTFVASYNPKAQATIYLDQVTRKMCPKLEQFVVFSSVTCGRGNGGQSNYGYSNSVMERVCENRRNSGLPGKAIQWGIIGDVGIIGDNLDQNKEVVVSGTVHQRIKSCLDVIDTLLECDDAIVSSVVIAEKQVSTGKDLTSVICDRLQIKDIKTVSPHTTFPELGMDSMMAVDIKQTLERDFDLFLSPHELRNMNLARLSELVSTEIEITNDSSTNDAKRKVEQMLTFVPDEDKCKNAIVRMKTTNSPTCLYLIPGIEGTSTIFEPFVENLSINVKCLQFLYNKRCETMAAFVKDKYQILKQELNPKQPFLIAAHSLGTSVAMETVSLLEQDGFVGTLILLDGSPVVNKIIASFLYDTTTEATLQTTFILHILSSILPIASKQSLKIILEKASSLEEKCKLAVDACPDNNSHSKEFFQQFLSSVYFRLKAELAHSFQPRSYKSKIVLCKASIGILAGLPKDFGLRELISNKVAITMFDGDHIDFLHNKKFVKFIEDSANNN